MQEAEQQIAINVDEALDQEFDQTDLQRAALATLALEGHADAQLTIAITSDAVVADLNQHYRGVEGPTDVLSFANQEPTPGFVSSPELVNYLGDVVIALPFTQRQAAAQGRTLGDELRLLVVHGTLHLLGHDHDGEEEAAMWARQETILASLAG